MLLLSTFKLVFEAPGEALRSRSFAAYLPSRQRGYCAQTSQSSCFRRTSLLYSNPKFRPPEWHVLHQQKEINLHMASPRLKSSLKDIKIVFLFLQTVHLYQ